MTPPRDGGFEWGNYAPQHRAVIALRREQGKRLTRCTLCGRTPITSRHTLVHERLKSVGAEDLDPKPLVKALALCLEHGALSCDALADICWPGWREKGINHNNVMIDHD